MPYKVISENSFDRLYNSSFFPVKTARTLARQLAGIDYSVVASRRQGHTLIDSFLSGGMDGDKIFSDEERYLRNSRSDVFLSNADDIFNNIVTAMTSSLSWRSTNNAKDTDAGTGAGKHEGNNFLAFDQGVQDNTKRWEELVKSFSKVCNDPGNVWTRNRFESEVAVWLEPGKGAPTVPK